MKKNRQAHILNFRFSLDNFRFKNILFLISIVFVCLSCEDVIDVELPTEDDRLIINGLVRVDQSKEYVGTEIRLTETDNFLGEITIASGASVTIQYGIEDEQGFLNPSMSSTLVERELGSGVYQPLLNSILENRIKTSDLTPETTLQITINYKGRLYFGKTMYIPSVPIDNLEQGDEILFEEDETEIMITYTDIETRDDFYVFDFDDGNFLTSEDRFYQGQQFGFSYFYDETIEPGRELKVSILGADREFFNYMNLILQQTEENFNIFDTPAATIRGNIFDVTDIDNQEQTDNTSASNIFPLGYFAVVETYTDSITVE